MVGAPQNIAAAAAGEDSWEVKVVVRCRPLLPQERAQEERHCVVADAQRNLVSIGTNLRSSIRCWDFDSVLDSSCTQQQCYEATVRPLVADCCAGYNVTAFAYGQTASGKTHTVFGSSIGEERGIAARVLEDLFDYVAREERDGGLAAVRITLTFIEIYREEVQDLLRPATSPKDLPLREDEGGGMLVAGALCEEVTCAEDAWQLLADGIARRATGGTFMNAVSSRSHAIATLAVERVVVSPEGRGDGLPVVTRSKFHLVDLAGTERADRTGATGMRFKESIKINQGLFTLGKVIRALSTPVGHRRSASSKRHVPYRESKLTRLLQDSLGGNSRTVMVACISPADADLQETVDTLKYATRARTIRNAPVINKGEVIQPPAMPSTMADSGIMPLQMHTLKLGLQSSLDANSANAAAAAAVEVHEAKRQLAASKRRERALARRLERNAAALAAAQGLIGQALNNGALLPTGRAPLERALERLMSAHQQLPQQARNRFTHEDSGSSCSADTEDSQNDGDLSRGSAQLLSRGEGERCDAERCDAVQCAEGAGALLEDALERDSLAGSGDGSAHYTTAPNGFAPALQHEEQASQPADPLLMSAVDDGIGGDDMVRFGGTEDMLVHTPVVIEQECQEHDQCNAVAEAPVVQPEGISAQHAAAELLQELRRKEGAKAMAMEEAAAAHAAGLADLRQRSARLEQQAARRNKTGRELARSAQEAAQLVRKYRDRVDYLKGAVAKLSQARDGLIQAVNDGETSRGTPADVQAALQRCDGQLIAARDELSLLLSQRSEHDDIVALRGATEARIRAVAAESHQISAKRAAVNAELRRAQESFEQWMDEQHNELQRLQHHIAQLEKKLQPPSEEQRRIVDGANDFKPASAHVHLAGQGGNTWLKAAVASAARKRRCEDALLQERQACSGLSAQLARQRHQLSLLLASQAVAAGDEDALQAAEEMADGIEALETMIQYREARVAELCRSQGAMPQDAFQGLSGLSAEQLPALLLTACEQLVEQQLQLEHQASLLMAAQQQQQQSLDRSLQGSLAAAQWLEHDDRRHPRHAWPDSTTPHPIDSSPHAEDSDSAAHSLNRRQSPPISNPVNDGDGAQQFSEVVSSAQHKLEQEQRARAAAEAQRDAVAAELAALKLFVAGTAASAGGAGGSVQGTPGAKRVKVPAEQLREVPPPA